MKKIKISLFIAVLVLAQNCFAQVDTWVETNQGIVVDVATGLVWQQTPQDNDINWFQANAFCENLVLANKNDWRLPNIKELASILDFRRNAPAIDLQSFGFPASQTDTFWSSTATQEGFARFKVLRFFNGTIDGDGRATNGLLRRVRCVRSN